jgi:hypothetical protein
MKNKFFKYCIALFFLCSSTMLFAQPGSGSDNGGVDGDGTGDTTPGEPMPIDDYVGILAVIGMSYVLIKVKPNQKKQNPSLDK